MNTFRLKQIFIFVIMSILSCLFTSQTQNTQYKLLEQNLDTNLHRITIVDKTGNEKVVMTFTTEGSLLSFQVLDDSRGFENIVNLEEGAINSFVIRDLRSGYVNITQFFMSQNNDRILDRTEIIGRIYKGEKVFSNGEIKITTE